MEFSTGLSLDNGLYQRQNVTTQLVQGMNVLQMSAVELEKYLEKLALENPVIELDEENKNSDAQMEFARKQDWLASGDRQNRSYYKDDSDEDSPENYWKDDNTHDNLSDFLLDQLILADYKSEDRQIIDYLILSLDSRGYCTEDLSEIAAYFGTTKEKVETLLGDIQMLEPAGVGARNLSECLELQLNRLHPESVLTRRIIRDYLPELGKNHLKDIARKMGASLSAVTECFDEIRTLNPKPGNAFGNRENLQYITPDALVLNAGDHFEVVINEHQYPQFQISSYYEHMEQMTDDKQVKDYLREKIQQANQVSSSIKMRNANLTRLMEFLVTWQEDFFRYGPGHKRPLKLADIAMEFQMHESTVSRTLRSKYVQCSWGVFPLRYFLSGISNVQQFGAQPQTQDRVKRTIKEIIEAEDKKKPLSDESIKRLLLERHGIDISRRTVNKYRQEMNIPDKGGRKDWKQ